MFQVSVSWLQFCWLLHGSVCLVWLCAFLCAGIPSYFVYLSQCFLKAGFSSVKKKHFCYLLKYDKLKEEDTSLWRPTYLSKLYRGWHKVIKYRRSEMQRTSRVWKQHAWCYSDHYLQNIFLCMDVCMSAWGVDYICNFLWKCERKTKYVKDAWLREKKLFTRTLDFTLFFLEKQNTILLRSSG